MFDMIYRTLALMHTLQIMVLIIIHNQRDWCDLYRHVHSYTHITYTYIYKYIYTSIYLFNIIKCLCLKIVVHVLRKYTIQCNAYALRLYKYQIKSIMHAAIELLSVNNNNHIIICKYNNRWVLTIFGHNYTLAYLQNGHVCWAKLQ